MKLLSKKTISWSEIYILTALVYFLSHGLMLSIYGTWWDDMLLWNVSQESIDEFMGPQNFNHPFMYVIVKSMNQIEDLIIRNFLYKFIPFFCWLISISCFFLFLKRISNNKALTLYASLIAASCGINKTMILICCYHYTISITLFMLGLVLFTYDYFKSNKFYLVLVSVFWTLSLLMWRTCVLLIPAILVVSVLTKMEINLKRRKFFLETIKGLISRYYIIIFGLFIFAVMYKTLLAPHGEYASYYTVRIKCMILSPITTMICCLSLLMGYIGNLFFVFSKEGTYVTAAMLILILLFSVLLYFVHSKPINNNKKMWYIALFFLYFAIMPHLLKSIALSFDINGYRSRFAALTIFPIGLICALVITSIVKTKLRIITCSFLVSLSICYSISTYLNYERGWLKNLAIASIFLEHRELQGKNIIFIDNTSLYSSFSNEVYAYYEYEGCAKVAYGLYDTTKCSELTQNMHYKHINIPDYYLTIEVNEFYPYIGLKAMLYRYFNKKRYDEIKNNLLKFRIESKSDYLKYKYQVL